jgi:hypothetical protein
MSGIAQGIPQALTKFVDPKTGILHASWYRFFNSLWLRTGGAAATTPVEDVIDWMNMADVPVPTPPEAAALMAYLMADAPQLPPASFDPMGDVPRQPENDPALIALMVS